MALGLSAIAVGQSMHSRHGCCFIQAFGGCILASLYVLCEPCWCKPLIGCWSFQSIRGFFQAVDSCHEYASSKGAAVFQVWCQRLVHGFVLCCNVESGCIARSSKWFFLVLNVVIFETTKEQGNILAFTCHEHMQ